MVKISTMGLAALGVSIAVMTAPAALADPADTAAPADPGTPVATATPVVASTPTVAASPSPAANPAATGGDVAAAPASGVPHLTSPQNLPPGTTDTRTSRAAASVTCATCCMRSAPRTSNRATHCCCLRSAR